MKVMLEKKSGRRIEICGEENGKTKYKFVGEEKEKSLKSTMFVKLFRDLVATETEDQITLEQSGEFKAAKTAQKAAQKADRTEEREDKKAEREAKKAERLATLIDENVCIKVVECFSYRNNIAIRCEINDAYAYISEVTIAGKVSYAWLEDNEGNAIPEFNNKGVGTVSPWIAEKLELKEAALCHMLKEARKNAIANGKITAEQVAERKAEVKAEKDTEKIERAKEVAEKKAARDAAKAAKEAKEALKLAEAEAEAKDAQAVEPAVEPAVEEVK